MPAFLIPAYNEESRIGRTLSLLTSEFPSYSFLVVFDGSDRTPEVVSRFSGVRLIRFGRRMGKGKAMVEGIRALQGQDVIILIDADMPVEVWQIREALKLIGSADLVIANRVYRGVPASRLVLHHLFNALARVMFPGLRRFADWQGGFKVMRADKARQVLDELIMSDFLIDTNLVYAFVRRGFRVVDVPMLWRHEEEGSKVSRRLFRVIVMDFLSLVKLRVYYSPLRRVLFTRAFKRAQDLALRVLR